MSRIETIERKTNETDIALEINLDGCGKSDIATGIGFFDHMLTHIAKHGRFDLNVKCKGDLHIDAHHSVEDIAIVLGQAFNKALGDKRGITRFASCSLPMEDALANVAIDLCGRPFCIYNVKYTSGKIGEFDVELVEEFCRAFTNNARLNLHINVPYGTNNHHIAEAIFKAMGRALSDAVKIDPTHNDVPSTKGML
ncbi:MAG: imidazoleglycerol-phosphate dehydratase HisB [Phycisphaerae bacterium]|nr:imidazoleglycerol-phosphate dehydratase HisB [Phycisphaerae bacterium]